MISYKNNFFPGVTIWFERVCMTLITKERKRTLNAHSSFWKEKGHRNQLVIVQ